MTAKVVLAVHWEALKLLAKGVGLRARPSPPATTSTVFRAEARPPEFERAA
jgi:DUF1365 family protein